MTDNQYPIEEWLEIVKALMDDQPVDSQRLDQACKQAHEAAKKRMDEATYEAARMLRDACRYASGT